MEKLEKAFEYLEDNTFEKARTLGARDKKKRKSKGKKSEMDTPGTFIYKITKNGKTFKVEQEAKDSFDAMKKLGKKYKGAEGIEVVKKNEDKVSYSYIGFVGVENNNKPSKNTLNFLQSKGINAKLRGTSLFVDKKQEKKARKLLGR